MGSNYGTTGVQTTGTVSSRSQRQASLTVPKVRSLAGPATGASLTCEMPTAFAELREVCQGCNYAREPQNWDDPPSYNNLRPS